MKLDKQHVDGAKLACWAAAVLAVTPLLLYPAGVVKHWDLHPGFFIFAAWALLCVAAVLKRRLAVWAALWLPPLALVSLDWLQGPREDPFGFHPWATIALFSGIALVVAATGGLSIVRAREVPATGSTNIG